MTQRTAHGTAYINTRRRRGLDILREEASGNVVQDGGSAISNILHALGPKDGLAALHRGLALYLVELRSYTARRHTTTLPTMRTLCAVLAERSR